MNFKVSAAPPTGLPTTITQPELDILVRKLQDRTNPKQQLKATTTLANLAHNTDNQIEIGKTDGAIDALVALLLSTTPKLQLAAAKVLAKLAHNVDNQTPIGEAGGAIVALAKALRSHNIKLQLAAATALANLAANHGVNQDKINAIDGTIKQFVNLLGSEYPRVQYVAATALSNLAGDVENRVLIGQNTDAIDKLVQLLKSPHAEVIEAAAKALIYLSKGIRPNKAGVEAAVIGSGVLDELHKNDNKDIQQKARETTGKVLIAPKNRQLYILRLILYIANYKPVDQRKATK